MWIIRRFAKASILELGNLAQSLRLKRAKVPIQLSASGPNTRIHTFE